MGVDEIAWIDQDEQKLDQAGLLFHRHFHRNQRQRIVNSSRAAATILSTTYMSRKTSPKTV